MQDYQQQQKAGIITIASGLAMVTVILVVQHLSVSSLMSATDTITLSEEQSAAFRSAALPTFGIAMTASGISLVGVLQIFSSWQSARAERTVFHRTKRSVVEALHKQKTAFWLALILYGIIFLFASNTIIYSAERISERYGVSVPSSNIIGCCGQPGSFPVLTVYLSEHIGLLLIPINMVLLLYLPLLVAINTAVIIQRLRSSKKGTTFGKNISFCGVSAGLLAGCPTCAGSVAISILGGGSSSAAAATMGLTSVATMATDYQPIFAIGSIAALIAAPLIMELKY
jgi:uncharacterized membrane protein YhaH (DUF805 family)